ncbi:hypothetical protein, partial [Enterobacter bugandensis]|uniref:hypothetical protein n=1 Tax=Enterobacter bugandensis TaxID=881260 RepID=UPI00168032F0
MMVLDILKGDEVIARWNYRKSSNESRRVIVDDEVVYFHDRDIIELLPRQAKKSTVKDPLRKVTSERL